MENNNEEKYSFNEEDMHVIDKDREQNNKADKTQNQNVETTRELNKANVDEIVSMIKLGLEQGDNLEDIKESLINTGYSIEKIKKAFEIFNKEKQQ